MLQSSWARGRHVEEFFVLLWHAVERCVATRHARRLHTHSWVTQDATLHLDISMIRFVSLSLSPHRRTRHI